MKDGAEYDPFHHCWHVIIARDEWERNGVILRNFGEMPPQTMIAVAQRRLEERHARVLGPWRERIDRLNKRRWRGAQYRLAQ